MGSHYRPNPDAMAQRVGDEVVLVHLKTDRIFALNQTGARIWELLSENLDAYQIQETLLREFEVDESQLKQEIYQLIESLYEQDLLVVSPQ